eukprot:821518-Pelagomonas_calceolata.AAC.1
MFWLSLKSKAVQLLCCGLQCKHQMVNLRKSATPASFQLQALLCFSCAALVGRLQGQDTLHALKKGRKNMHAITPRILREGHIVTPPPQVRLKPVTSNL